MEKEEKIVEGKKPSEYKLVEVPTGKALAYQTPEGEAISQEEAIVELLNMVKGIKKQVS